MFSVKLYIACITKIFSTYSIEFVWTMVCTPQKNKRGLNYKVVNNVVKEMLSINSSLLEM